METEKKQLLNSIEEAELVLLGIGTEFQVGEEEFKNQSLYRKWKEANKQQEALWMEPFLRKVWLSQQKNLEVERAYEALKKMLEGKNYFIVTLCTDGLIYEKGFEQERIVAPCGNMQYLQCDKGCTKELYAWTEEMEKQLAIAVENGSLGLCQPFVCPHCGEPLVWNTVKAEKYNEEGYLPMWNRYTKWLQGMLNRKVCIVEAGVDFSYPTVIRWPFEKMAFFNNKAEFFRIHANWYQLTEELKKKGVSIPHNSREFFVNLFV